MHINYYVTGCLRGRLTAEEIDTCNFELARLSHQMAAISIASLPNEHASSRMPDDDRLQTMQLEWCVNNFGCGFIMPCSSTTAGICVKISREWRFEYEHTHTHTCKCHAVPINLSQPNKLTCHLLDHCMKTVNWKSQVSISSFARAWDRIAGDVHCGANSESNAQFPRTRRTCSLQLGVERRCSITSWRLYDSHQNTVLTTRY